MTLKSFAHSIILAWGWRRAAIAFSAGALSSLAMAPVHAWPLLFFTFPLLVWLTDGAVGRFRGAGAAAFTGWCFGFGYFLAGLYWVGAAFLVDAQIFGWLLPFAVTLLPAGLAVFTAIGVLAARLLWRPGAMRILALALGLTASEWLRGHVLTGFPWNAFGYALTGPLALAQSAALIGLWGLTFVAVAVFASPATLADEAGTVRRRALPLALSLLVVGVMAIFGALRLNAQPTAYVEGVRLRILQPNLQQNQKFNYAARHEVMRRYLEMSDRATGPQSNGVRDVTHLIWPESAFPFFLPREPEALAQISALLPEGTILLTGGVRPPETPPGGRITRAYNSVYVLDHQASILSIYDKVHLVPFGEYLPFQDAMERLGLVQLTKVQGGFIPGDRRRSLTVPGAPKLVPLVCYEVIFPGEVVPPNDRPGWMLNLTNDGWFGLTSGPYQHLQQARVRAIEEGLPVVRAANTGISAIIDPLGRMTNFLPLGREGVLDGRLPVALTPTLYARAGDAPAALLVGAALLLMLVRTRRA